MARKMGCEVSFNAGTLEEKFKRECSLDEVLEEVNALISKAEQAEKHGGEGRGA